MERASNRYPRAYWRSPAPDVAVRIEDGTPVALIVYAPDGLRSSDLRRLTAELLNDDARAFPISDKTTPPSRASVNEPWEWALADLATDPIVIGLRAVELAHAYVQLGGQAHLLERREGQSATAFYEGVADFHREATRLTGRGTKAIADIGNVPHTTAARWVREARKRGIPLTDDEWETQDADAATGAATGRTTKGKR